MNHLQDLILDRLIGTPKIGRFWKNGPLALAVQALQEKQLTAHSDATLALGFPMAMCEALQGASHVLKKMEERRELAVAFFAEVPPQPARPRLTQRRHVGIARWAAYRVHPLVCRKTCPTLKQTDGFLARFERGGALDWAVLNAHHISDSCRASWTTYIECRQQPQPWYLTAESYGWYALQYTRQTALTLPRPLGAEYGPRVQRFAARVEALVNGKDGALDFCLALAKELGLR